MILGIAVGIVVAVAGLAVCQSLVGSSEHGREPLTVGTGVGESQTFDLADRSTLTLNSDSEVALDLASKFRSVQLRKGEALFEVAHDSARPFRVCVNRRLIIDLGTRFNVSADGRSTTVSVTEGRIALGGTCSAGPSGELVVEGERGAGPDVHADAQVVIAAGYQVFLPDPSSGASPRIHRMSSAEMTRVLAWKDRLLMFYRTPLAEALNQINRYFPRHLEIADPDLADLQISGTYHSSSQSAILQMLHETYGLVPVGGDDPDSAVILLEKERSRSPAGRPQIRSRPPR
ncbi:MAG TPA: FecR domain-containing protein [Steroidobacteraceae bacterium]|jgi:transmembrane sensor